MIRELPGGLRGRSPSPRMESHSIDCNSMVATHPCIRNNLPHLPSLFFAYVLEICVLFQKIDINCIKVDISKQLIFTFIFIMFIFCIFSKKKIEEVFMSNPNPNKQTVELNRTSLYWGLLLIFVLAVLFSSYIFN